VRDLRFLELIHNIEERKQKGESNNHIFLADIFAHQGKFQEAAQLYKKAGQEEKAVEMFTDLRQFNLAKDFLGGSGKKNVKDLITKQADWARTTNDPQSACDMYMAAREYAKAVDIMGENGWVDRLLGLVHELDKSQTEMLRKCAHYLMKLGQYAYAADVYEKLEDHKALVNLYVETHQWDNAFELTSKQPDYKVSGREFLYSHVAIAVGSTMTCAVPLNPNRMMSTFRMQPGWLKMTSLIRHKKL